MKLRGWLMYSLLACLMMFACVAVRAGVGENAPQPIRTHENGVAIHSYGSTYVYEEPIDIFTGIRLQEDNNRPITRMRLLKSADIKEGWTGGCPPRLPRSEYMDPLQAPVEPINLLDGDPKTYWCSRGQNRPNVQEEWIRIDLGMEITIQSIVLVREQQFGSNAIYQKSDPFDRRVCILGNGVPKKLQIMVSRDAWNWDTVYESDDYRPPDETESRLTFEFEPQPVKQIWIRGNGLPLVSQMPYINAFSFSLAGVEALNEKGENMALASRGAGIQVSSTCPTYPDSRYIHDGIWATAWDLGLKYVRVSAWDSVLQWSYVEREAKGQYFIDPVADQAVTDLAQHGVNVIMSLCYSNWLYTSEGGRPYRPGLHAFTDIAELAPLPVDGELRQAYLRWVRHMAEHFKGRVKYYCIWNEPQNAGGNYGWGDPELFGKLCSDVMSTVREVDSDVKFAWPTAYTKQKFHDRWFGSGFIPVPQFDLAHADLSDPRGQKQRWRDHGFTGRFVTYEMGISSAYPNAYYEKSDDSLPAINELLKAKMVAANTTQEAAEEIIYSMTEWYMTYNTNMGLGMFRNGFASSPFTPTQPQLAYYVMRNMSTLLAETKPKTWNYWKSDEQHSYQIKMFEKSGRPFIAVWIGPMQKNGYSETRCDFRFPGMVATRITAYDSLNGLRQELQFIQEGNDILIPGLLIKDYPIFIDVEP